MTEPQAGDTFCGPPSNSEIPRTFGGHLLGQALASMAQTVSQEQVPLSFHSYFVAPGASSSAVEYYVERVRDGRSVSHRSVRGVQEGKTVFIGAAAFHRRDESGPRHSRSMPELAGPEQPLPKDPPSSRAFLQEWEDFDLRMVPGGVWMKHAPLQQDDLASHAVLLAYMSDMTLLHTALEGHPAAEVAMASLDHSLQFLDDFRVDEWLLFHTDSPHAAEGRALTHGSFFTSDGRLVAEVTQRGLTRH
ncbi:acyl-CoA thioesterase [Corynebacterium tapiri]|nr:acyl-CoA thioesterase domain-containing protein [Corynebacterium tapiri]